MAIDPTTPRADAPNDPGELCVVGSVNLDLVVAAPRLPAPGETVLGGRYEEYPGGKGLNQAVAGARAGARTRLCACIGDDAAGERLRATASAAGVITDHVEVAPGVPTGRAIIATATEEAQNLIVVAPGANAALTARAASACAPAARVVLAQLEIPADVVVDVFGVARGAGAVTVLNPAPADSVSDRLLALCDYVIPNAHEASSLGGAGALLAAGARHVIVTRGPDGSVLSAPGEPDHAQAAFAVEAIDSTAAGDAYCGAFAAALASGHDARGAMRFASAAGALATSRAGAVPSIPTRDEIEQRLDRADRDSAPHPTQRVQR